MAVVTDSQLPDVNRLGVVNYVDVVTGPTACSLLIVVPFITENAIEDDVAVFIVRPRYLADNLLQSAFHFGTDASMRLRLLSFGDNDHRAETY